MEVNELYSLQKIEHIARGDQAFLRKMINLFLEQAPSSVKDIRQAYEKKDFAAMAAQAHRLKSALDTMAITSLQQDIRALERMDHEEAGTAEAGVLINKLETVIDQVVAQVRTI
ncbi:Hpt domain-containing protein [Chitinophaga agrisoli]|uniref:Hpt domain-containing protein n=1 Tax=Chitinophaga agrisoli TaxID=2607653 RepID=A0A5B2VTN6_9BACT|nr:Hpt domain-containing protein [Chitinophaga agrisoli]KAA2242581.1 Hpt domain-containing protein [Chitinophaga agrisoli]